MGDNYDHYSNGVEKKLCHLAGLFIGEFAGHFVDA
jgi:hypothetical protein